MPQAQVGIRLAFDEVGNGVPLVLLHGFPHNRTIWSRQLEALASSARCVAPDLRGFGESEARPPHSMDQYADDVAALIRSLNLGPVVLGGLSMGGYIAFAFWRRHASMVRALILADTRAGADSEEGRARRNETIQLAKARGVPAVADAQISGMLGKTTRERSPEVVEQVRAMMAAAPLNGLVGALEAMRDRPDSTSTLATINVPVLIAVGDEDVLTPVREARLMHAGIPGSLLEIVEKAGHLSNLERPSAFSYLVDEFLASLSVE